MEVHVCSNWVLFSISHQIVSVIAFVCTCSGLQARHVLLLNYRRRGKKIILTSHCYHFRKESTMKHLVGGRLHLPWHLTMQYFTNRKLRFYLKWEMHGMHWQQQPVCSCSLPLISTLLCYRKGHGLGIIPIVQQIIICIEVTELYSFPAKSENMWQYYFVFCHTNEYGSYT